MARGSVLMPVAGAAMCAQYLGETPRVTARRASRLSTPAHVGRAVPSLRWPEEPAQAGTPPPATASDFAAWRAVSVLSQGNGQAVGAGYYAGVRKRHVVVRVALKCLHQPSSLPHYCMRQIERFEAHQIPRS